MEKKTVKSQKAENESRVKSIVQKMIVPTKEVAEENSPTAAFSERLDFIKKAKKEAEENKARDLVVSTIQKNITSLSIYSTMCDNNKRTIDHLNQVMASTGFLTLEDVIYSLQLGEREIKHSFDIAIPQATNN